jgi:hypothetical protein
MTSKAILAGGNVAQPGLIFKPSIVGPAGPPPGEPIPPSVARVVELIPPAYQMGQLALDDERWTLVSVDRPTMLVPFDASGGFAFLEASVRYSPSKPINNTGVPSGILASRARPYFPQPGDWWVQLDTGVTGGTLPFLVVDCTDPLLTYQLLRPTTAGFVYSGTVNLPAATATTVLPLTNFLQSTFMEVENAGANGIRFTFGDVIPDASTGFNLPTVASDPTNAYRRFSLEELPVAAIRAFSNLGSDMRIVLGQESAP